MRFTTSLSASLALASLIAAPALSHATVKTIAAAASTAANLFTASNYAGGALPSATGADSLLIDNSVFTTTTGSMNFSVTGNGTSILFEGIQIINAAGVRPINIRNGSAAGSVSTLQLNGTAQTYLLDVNSLDQKITIGKTTGLADLNLSIVNSGTINVTNSGTLLITAPISEVNTVQLTKTGTGKLGLGGSNNFTGGFVIANGPVGTGAGVIGDAAVTVSTTNAFGSGAISFTGAPLNLKAISFNLGASGTIRNAITLPSTAVGALRIQNEASGGLVTTLSGLISGGEALSSTLDLGSNTASSTSIFRLTNPSNSFTMRTVNVQRGALAITSDAVLGSSAARNNTVRLDTAVATRGLRFDYSGAFTHDIGVSSTSGIDVRGDNDGDGTLDTSNDVVISGSINNRAASTAAIQFNGGTLVNGTSFGSVTLTATNDSFQNAVTVTSNLKLILGSKDALGAIGGGTTTINSGATLAFGNVGTYASAEQVILSGSGVQLGGVGVGAIENITGVNSFPGPLTMAANTTIGATSGTLTLSGSIAGGGFSLTKTGTGRLILSGNNTANSINNLVIANGPGNATVTGGTSDSSVTFNGTNSLVTGAISFAGSVPSNLKALGFNFGTNGIGTVANDIVLPSSGINVLRINNDGSGQKTTLSGLISGGEATSSTLMFSSGLSAATSFFRLTNASNSFAAKEIYLQRGGLAITSNAALGAASNKLVFSEQTQVSGLRTDAANLTITHDIDFIDYCSIFLKGDNDGDGTTDTSNDLTLSGNIGGTRAAGYAFPVFIQGGSNDGTNSIGTLTLTGTVTTDAGLLVAPETTLVLANANALGSGTGTFSTQTNATIALSNLGTVTGTRTINLNGVGSMVSSNRVGALENRLGNNALTGPVRLSQSASIGVTTGTLTLNGGITTANGTNNLTTLGAGRLVLNSDSAVSGTTFVTAGILEVNGNSTASALHLISPGATLTGSGSLGATTVSGIITPTGVMTTGSLTLDGGYATFTLNSSSSYTSINASDVSLLNGAIFSFSLGYSPAENDSFVLINNTGLNAVNGTFAGFAEGAIFSGGGYNYSISYVGGTGNDVLLTVVPEPATIGMLAIAGAFAATRRRRRN